MAVAVGGLRRVYAELIDEAAAESLVRLALDRLGCSLDVHEGDQVAATTSHDRTASRPH